ncbi:MAG: hypothetical protein ACLSFO_06255 [Anaerovoracaceae bacterium]
MNTKHKSHSIMTRWGLSSLPWVRRWEWPTSDSNRWFNGGRAFC